MNRISRYALNICMLVAPAVASAAEVELRQIMTSEEIESTGLNTLTPEEQRAFARWIEQWTKKVIQEAPTYHQSQSLSEWIQTWPNFLKPNADKNSPQNQVAQEKSRQKIYRNMNGTSLALMDGSVWKIVSFDQPAVRLWKRGETIRVTPNSQDLMRPFILTNLNRNEQVGAHCEQEASASFAPEQEDSKAFQDSLPIISIDRQMGHVQLSDQSRWKIAPMDQIAVCSSWKKQDHIRVEKSKDALYSYKLENLDNGDYALAIKLR